MSLNECEIGKKETVILLHTILITRIPTNLCYLSFYGRRISREEETIWKRAVFGNGYRESMYYYAGPVPERRESEFIFAEKSFSFLPEKHGTGLYKRSVLTIAAQ